jgi:hypothetical protein
MKAERKPRPGRRHVHLGERLEAVARVRGGEAMQDVAVDIGVAAEDLHAWVAALAGDRVHTIEELRHGDSPERMKLVKRARRLADLVAESERTLRDLHQELIAGISPSNDEEAEPSKELERNPQFGATRVPTPQREPRLPRKFVDGDSTR